MLFYGLNTMRDDVHLAIGFRGSPCTSGGSAWR
jgi:hypothetical protein